MKFLLLAAHLMLVSCASRTSTYVYYEDPNFATYIRSFEREFGVKVEVPSAFGVLTEDRVGGCYYTGIANSRANNIVIDRKAWREYNEGGREQLIYHELGHCVLGLDHDDTVGEISGIIFPISIMNSYVFGNHWLYVQEREHYINDLRSRL
jgi:hypothetical protein